MLPSIYAICLIVGGVIVSVSAFAGGHDADADVDVGGDIDVGGDVDVGGDIDVGGDLDVDGDVDIGGDIDADADMDGDFHAAGDIDHGGSDFDASVWIPFLSMRFWTFFTAFFGLTGSVFTFLNLAGVNATLITSIIMGVFCGWVAATSVKLLQKSSVTSITSERSYQGKIGKVIVGAEAGGRGRIRINELGGTVDFPARMNENVELLAGTYVVVVSIENSVASVMPCPEEAIPEPEKHSSIGKSVKRTELD